MQNRFVILALLLTLMWATCPMSPTAPSLAYAQAPSDAPYLYYFALDRMAWVIERADGTDTHVIGAGLVEKPTDPYESLVIGGPGWSPSGQWLAFSAQKISPNYTPLARQPHVISADGQQTLAEIEKLPDAQMVWSPTHDWLLVTADYIVQNPSRVFQQSTLLLIDVAQQHTIYQRETRTPLPLPNGGFFEPIQPTLRWSPDGERAIVEMPQAVGDEQPEATQITILDGQGRVSTTTFTNVLSPYDDSFYFSRDPISAQGDLIYRTDGGFVVENVLSGRQVTFNTPLPELQTPYWSPDGHYAVLSGDGLRLVTIADDAIEFKVIHTTLPALYSRNLWSPNSQDMVFDIPDDGVYHLNAATQTLTLLQASDQWWANTWVWLPNSQLILSVPQSTDHCCVVLRYDFAQHDEPIESIEYSADWYYHPPVPSEDGRYLGAVNDGAQIYDRQTGSLTTFRPDADGYYSDNSGWIEWHGDWFLIYEGALIASGGDGGVHIGVGNVKGTHRELTFSRTSEPTIIAGWLPPQVQLDQLAPAFPPAPQPSTILHSDHWNFRVSWSPDGQQLAAGTDLFLAGGEITVWSMATSAVISDFNNIYADYGFKNWAYVAWQPQADQTYQAVLVDTPLADPQRFPYATAISPDGRWTVARSTQGWAVLDSATATPVHLLENDNHADLMSSSFSPDGHYLALGYSNSPGELWDTQTWQIVARLPATSPGLAFSPNGDYLALGVSWDVEIWRVSDLLEP